jgi:para-nitrobenzyl esterase
MNAPLVEISSGRVEGAPSRGVLRFKGIPYAAPPIGDRRFAPPAPAAPWSGVLEAVGRPPTAPQPVGAMEAMAGAANLPPQSEADCLTLNVWTESLTGARPVMVWIHGGAFVSGSGTTPWYDGANLAKRGVVVVTVNYRLGALGFLHLEGLGGERFAGAANAGLLDQALALQWVADNISAFGGDPNQVTIFGESAGGMSVGCQLALPASKGLFRTAIPQSGAASHARSAEAAEEVAVAVLAAVGLEPSEVKKVLDLPTEALVAATEKLSGRSRIDAGLPFVPTIDGSTLPVAPQEAVAAGACAGVGLLTGLNAEEMRLFAAMDPRMASTDDDQLRSVVSRVVPGDPDVAIAAYRDQVGPGASPSEVLQAVLTDSVFRIPAIRLLEAQAPHARTHAYEFRFRSPGFGAAHAVEIPVAFDNLDAPGATFFVGEATDAMRELSTLMADTWVDMATRGTPGEAWPAYDAEHRQTRILDLEPSVESDPGSATRKLWSDR